LAPPPNGILWLGQGIVPIDFLPDVVEEGELGSRQGQPLSLLLVAARQRVGHHVHGARLILHDEVEPQQLACPLVLRNRCETLVEEEAKTPVIHAHHETAPPQVRAPMPNRLDEPDQLALVGSELGVTRRDGPAEERDRPSSLMKHGAKA